MVSGELSDSMVSQGMSRAQADNWFSRMASLAAELRMTAKPKKR